MHTTHAERQAKNNKARLVLIGIARRHAQQVVESSNNASSMDTGLT